MGAALRAFRPAVTVVASVFGYALVLMIVVTAFVVWHSRRHSTPAASAPFDERI